MVPFNLLGGIGRKAELMECMMGALGVRRAIVERPDAPQVMRNAAMRCMTCTHGAECEAWLVQRSEPDAAPAFCRNKELFDHAVAHPAD